MTYISRRLLVTNEQGNDIEYSDIEFFVLDAPLIVLGEPGAGKSELVRQYAEKSGSRIYNASSIDIFPLIEMLNFPAKTIIDGIDEITAYESGAFSSILKLLAKLNDPDAPSFVLTCRAADWQDAVNTRIIRDRWQQKPVVGRILPLNKREVVSFVNANGNGQNGEEFFQEAQRRDVVDLLKNPQNLILLLKAIQNDGWPDTRLKLYENACLTLIQEDNEIHDSLNRTRPTPEKLIEAAGFIFAQLLLSGTTRIRVEGIGNAELPKITDLTSSDFDNSIIRNTLSTKVFHIVTETVLEPCHRTVAEFLAAKWLTGALKNKLSLRRLENLVYGNGHIVPAALRGLHAWIATLYPAIADKFIARDPYGFFRYGDPAVLTVFQSRNLLLCLEKVAEADPYFRSKDWDATFGRGLARPELREDIVRLICSPASSYQLSHLLIESIQRDSFVSDIAEDLLILILDSAVTPLQRLTAADALLCCEVQLNWNQVVDQLIQSTNIESYRVALQVVEERISLFDGVAIANLLVKSSEIINSDEFPNFSGLGYGIHKKMSLEQLDSSLQAFSNYQKKHNKKHRSNPEDVEHWIFKFVQERLNRSVPPNATTIWSWLQNTGSYGYHRSDWDKFAADYFSQHVELRLAVQVEALRNAKNEENYWNRLTAFGFTHSFLRLRENDIILHMNTLLNTRNQYADWPVCWRHLVRHAKMHRDFSGSAIEHAHRQATEHAELKEQLTILEQPIEWDFDKENNAHEQKRKEVKKCKMQSIHKTFKEIQNQLEAGQHLQALSDVAKAYLGRFSDLRTISTPRDRVTELVGNQLCDVAFKGLTAAMHRSDIPTARQIIELHANEQKEFFFEPILLAHCAITLQTRQTLSAISLEIGHSALSACHWGLSYGDEFTSDLQKQLEEIIFANKDSKEVFIRDTMEPYLNTGADHIPGLYRLARNEEFSNVAGLLAIEWLNKYSQLSNNSLRELLIAAIRYAPKCELIALLRDRIYSDEWNNEDQRDIWIGAAFLLDFDHHHQMLITYADERKEHLWPLRAIAFQNREKIESWPKLNELQTHFLITKFGSYWPPVDFPSGTWGGDQNPWDADRFIKARIDDLAANTSDQAENLLKELINHRDLESYQDHIKHAYAQQTRQRAEKNKKLLSLAGLRKVLLQTEPVNIDDLQSIVFDELELLQRRLKDSQTNGILPYWNNGNPHGENDCRDRVAEYLELALKPYGIRSHIEGAMPTRNRCDLLHTYGDFNLPIEIKGQWHPEVWTAASNQLVNYQKDYRSEGRGIYLVLWFGYLGARHDKNPHGWKGQKLPKTLDEMKNLLLQRYDGISEKTKIIVIDISK